MILRNDGDDYVVFYQKDHGRQAREFAAAWGRPPFAELQPSASILLAIELHDYGWHQWDEEPTLDPEGLPHALFTIPIADHVALYRRGVDHVAAVDRYAGLLVCMHASGLYRSRHGTVPGMGRTGLTSEERQLVEQFVADERAREENLRRLVSDDPAYRGCTDEESIWHNYKLLQVFDRLSLYCLVRPLSETSLAPVPVGPEAADQELRLTPLGEREVRIEPYPFLVEPLSTTVPLARVRRRRFESAAAWRQALRDAPRETWTFTFRS